MSGDLEDFLRRAAERRRTKASPPPSPPPRRRPEYTDSRRERVTEPIEVAEIVEEPIDADLVDEVGRSLSEQQKRIEAARRRAEEIGKQARQGDAASSRKAAGKKKPAPSVPVDTTLSGLKRMLQSPEGMKQAILLKEILERPEHRW